MTTESLCPVCLQKLEAAIEKEGTAHYLVKTCPEHGTFRTVVWREQVPMETWVREKEPTQCKSPVMVSDKGCPFDCGPCKEHRQHTCTALIEVTDRCNLSCRFCFADAAGQNGSDSSLSVIQEQFENIQKISGLCNIQLSGGEPTLRNDLPEIVRMGKQCGFPFIQVNTNGIRLAADENYVMQLKEAGLDSVFLQFDGINDEIYQTLRGRRLLEVKEQAIEHCRKYGIGVILVVTVVPGINDNAVGEIISYAVSRFPIVRGVHYQPVSYFGRTDGTPEDADRITLDEVMMKLSQQTQEMIRLDSLKPPGCEHALCSFNGNYLVQDQKLISISPKSTCCCKASAEEGARKAKKFVARQWGYQEQEKLPEPKDDWDKILGQLKTETFSISGMAFQDVWNLNLERVRDCCIHVATTDGRLIPFCMYNLTNASGEALYRNHC